MLDRLERLPAPQRDALRTAFGLSSGSAPDRFLVGLAVLSLLSDVAEEQPLICLVDDAAVARSRLGAGPRRSSRAAWRRNRSAWCSRPACPSDELAGLPELVVEGLRGGRCARAAGRGADRARWTRGSATRSSAETRGNPLALLELPRGLTPAELAGGFALPGAVPLTGRIEESFRRRLDALPADDPAAAAARGGRSGRRPAAGVASSRAARDPGSGCDASEPRPACSSSAPACGSGTRWCARRPTGRRRSRSDRTCTAPWRRSPIRSSIPTAAPGTGPRPRPGPTRTSPRSSSARPAAPRRAGAWPRRPRSWSARRC